MVNTLNCIHAYRWTVHLRSILEDIEAIKGTKSFANINKQAYEYKASNTFEIRDELIILDKGNKANTTAPPESSPLEGQKVINPKPIASTSATDKLVCPKQHIMLRGSALPRPLSSNTTSHT